MKTKDRAKPQTGLLKRERESLFTIVEGIGNVDAIAL